MTKVRIRPDALSIESILEKVGPVKFERPLSFSPPYEDDEQNKAWFMEKAILLRHVFERFPQHEAALSCLIQYCYLELGYPVLVAATNNELNAKDTKRLLSLQKRNDTSSKKYYSDYERAFKPIQEIQDARAQGILLEHPNLG
ncbi:MAG: hypothetical protein OXG24_12220, partial [Gammaproteobacteria bacterium]|nr:hypothetical protein [Gammaproteobacteria bacterium]